MSSTGQPTAIQQDGTPLILPQSSVEIEISTDPKRLPGATIKVYGPDGAADYAEALRLANDFIQRREHLGRLTAEQLTQPNPTFPI